MVKKHNSLEILSLLLSHKKETFTIRSIAKHTSIDYKTAYLIVQELAQEKVIKTQKIGQTVLCSINNNYFSDKILTAEMNRRDKILKNKIISTLCSYLNTIKDPFFILLLFGSQASGQAQKQSDIDLMLIADNPSIKQKVKDKLSLVPLDIHLLDFSPEEFSSMITTTKFNVGKEAFYNNIILFGIEDYYRLLQNA